MTQVVIADERKPEEGNGHGQGASGRTGVLVGCR